MRICLAISLLLVIFAVVSLCAQENPIAVKAEVDKQKITIGDKVTFSLTIEYEPKIKLNEIEVAPALALFEIKDHSTIGPKKPFWKKKVTVIHKHILTTFTSGNYTIEPITIRYSDEKGEGKEIKTEKIIINVEPVKASATDKDDIRDIKQPLAIKRSWIFYAVIIGLPILLVVGFFAYKYYKGKKQVETIVPVDTRSPVEIAYEKLNELKAMNLIEKGEIKNHYIILSEIIREYLEAEFKIPVLDRTTTELVHELKNSSVDKKHQMLVREFLECCDLVKFAKYVPIDKEIDSNFNSAKNIVDATKPKETVSPHPDPLPQRGEGNS